MNKIFIWHVSFITGSSLPKCGLSYCESPLYSSIGWWCYDNNNVTQFKPFWMVLSFIYFKTTNIFGYSFKLLIKLVKWSVKMMKICCCQTSPFTFATVHLLQFQYIFFAHSDSLTQTYVGFLKFKCFIT